MLRSIPTVSSTAECNDDVDDGNKGDGFDKGMNACFDTINAKLAVFENLLNEALMLFSKQFGLVESIVQNILSYTECNNDLETMQLADTAASFINLWVYFLVVHK